jgi:hypothetical protein
MTRRKTWAETAFAFQTSFLDQWFLVGNLDKIGNALGGPTLVGRLYNAEKRGFEKGEWAQSDCLRFLDAKNFEAETLTEKIKLGTPGSLEEYRRAKSKEGQGTCEATDNLTRMVGQSGVNMFSLNSSDRVK